MKKQNYYNTIIIGAGASGLMAACELSKTTDSILILERMNQPGKKILATGNGKCNLTNLYMNENCFRGTGSRLAMYGTQIMSPDALRDYFYDLGLLTLDRNGYVYPMTEQAKTVLYTLLRPLSQKKIDIRAGQAVIGIQYFGDYQFEITTEETVYQASHVILACGGSASPKLGSDGSGYSLAKQLGLSIVKPLPALTGLCSARKYFKNLAGVRTKGCLSYFCLDGRYVKEQGEIQLADYGISGIPVFQISRYVIADLEQKKECQVEFDFFPDLTFQDLKEIVQDFRNKEGMTCQDVLGGIVHEKWVPVLLGESGISPKDSPFQVPEKKWNKLIQHLKQFPIPIKGYRGLSYAQCTQGGVDAAEVSTELETKKYKGLYITGELLDVDGTCGGYNLHWAFTSGYIAAKSIAGKQEKTE